MSFVTVAVVGGAVSLASTAAQGIIGASNAKKAKKTANRQKMSAQLKMANLEANRQEIINPYEGIKDTTGNLSNEFANLGVATQAAEMQIEQTDIALANTLDTLRATGSGAGGATALAQAALQSKKGVAASIESQEAKNQKLKAQGEQTLQAAKQAEAQRLQTAEVAGKSFVYDETEKREMTQLDRAQAEMDNARAAEVQADADKAAVISSSLSAVGDLGASVGGAAIGRIPV